MSRFFNCHVHLFTERAIPRRIFPLGAFYLFRSRPLNWVLRQLHRIQPTEALERLVAFGTIGRTKSSRAMFERLRGYYTEEFRFVVLSLDMDHMGAGRAPQPYLEQLRELRELKADRELGPHLLPFVSVDPRREGVLDLVRTHVEDHGFAGIKLYPALGFWPFAPELDPVYAYAERNRIPVLTHCSRGGVHFRGRIPKSARRHPITGDPIKGWRKRTLAQAFSDPDNYGPVLERFPELRLCLAHYGGGEEWDAYLVRSLPVDNRISWVRKVTDLLKRHEHAYADVSHLADEPEFLPLIHVFAKRPDIGPKLLFGTDFYMVQRKASERQFSLRLRSTLGDEAWERMAYTNPKRFLGIP